MNAQDDPGRVVSDWLHEYGAHRVPGHLDAVLRETSTRRQRPAWSSLERWLPMQSTLRSRPRPGSALILLLVLTFLAVVGIALITSGRGASAGPAHRPRPQWADGVRQGGRHLSLRSSDGRGGGPRRGTENDTAPLFSRDGSHLLFARGPDGANPASVVVADADGTHAHQVIGPLTDWSLDRLVAERREGGDRSSIAGTPSITVVNADGSGSTVLDVGMPATFPSWTGPDGTDILFRGDNAARTAARYLPSRPTASSPRPVSRAASADARFHDPVVSLDGTHVTYSSFEPSTWQPASGTRTAGWDGNLEEGHVLELANGHDALIPPGTDPLVASQPVDEFRPVLAPDGSMVVFERDRSDGKGWLALAPSDGSAPGRQVGVEFTPSDGESPTYAFTPDGTMIIATYPGETITHLLPVAGGAGTTAPGSGSGASDMQRVAP